jgi:hypothetical protein
MTSYTYLLCRVTGITVGKLTSLWFLLKIPLPVDWNNLCRLKKFIFPWGGGHEVAQLVEALRCKQQGRGFDSQWRHWNNPSGRTMVLGSTQPLAQMNTNNISCEGGGKGGRCVGLTTLPPSYADCLELWEPQSPRTLRASTGLCRNWLSLPFIFP